jgi:hypothetical protein
VSILQEYPDAYNANGDSGLILSKDRAFKMYGTALSMADKINPNVHNVFKGMYWVIISATKILEFAKNTIISMIHAYNASPHTLCKTINASPSPVKAANIETMMAYV